MPKPRSVLNGLKTVHLCITHYYQHECFLFYNDFCKLVIITKNLLKQLKCLQFDSKASHILNLIYIIKFDDCSEIV